MGCRLRLSVFALAVTAGACANEQTVGARTELERGLAEFRICAVCHARTDPADPKTVRLAGPSLFGIAGAPAAHLADYDYSPAMRRANLVWDDATLDAYIADPQAVVPGTRMSFPGEPDIEKRAAIIAYLKTLK